MGVLYAINTLGAVLGVMGSGFVLLPNLGLSRSLWLTCVSSGVVALTAFVMYCRSAGSSRDEGRSGTTQSRVPESPEPDRVTSPPPAPAGGRLSLRLLLIGYAAAGFASLAYEVAWTRGLVLLIGSSVYAFTLMLTAFILGIGLGSLVFAH